MAKKIEVSFDAGEIRAIFDDGTSPLMSKREAQQLLNKVKDRAEEIIALEAAKIIHTLILRAQRQ